MENKQDAAIIAILNSVPTSADLHRYIWQNFCPSERLAVYHYVFNMYFDIADYCVVEYPIHAERFRRCAYVFLGVAVHEQAIRDSMVK